MQNIHIVSNSKCTLSLDVIGKYQLSLVNVSGIFNTLVLESSVDFLTFDYGNLKYTINFDNYINMNGSLFESLVNTKSQELANITLLSFDTLNNKFTTLYPISDCSNRVKIILGARSLPHFGEFPLCSLFANSGVIFIKSNELNPLTRYAWQTGTEPSVNKYAGLQNIVSVNLNTFATSFPFSLAGNTYIVDDSQLKHIEFRITDLYDNDIIFQNDIIWSFTLEFIRPEVYPVNMEQQREAMRAEPEQQQGTEEQVSNQE